MHIDELHKFSDGTLNDVRTALNDRLNGIQMKYLPQTIQRQSDRDKVGAMIHAIDKQLKTRRIMRSLEKFVGGQTLFGYVKYHKKSVKKRTRERMSDQEAKELKAEAREIMPQPSTVNCS
ncbi:hypothetical protein Tco_1381896 [Tanacetum coccineum]